MTWDQREFQVCLITNQLTNTGTNHHNVKMNLRNKKSTWQKELSCWKHQQLGISFFVNLKIVYDACISFNV